MQMNVSILWGRHNEKTQVILKQVQDDGIGVPLLSFIAFCSFSALSVNFFFLPIDIRR